MKTCEDLNHLFTRLTNCLFVCYVLSVKSEDLFSISLFANQIQYAFKPFSPHKFHHHSCLCEFVGANIIYRKAVFPVFPVAIRTKEGDAGKTRRGQGKTQGKNEDILQKTKNVKKQDS